MMYYCPCKVVLFLLVGGATIFPEANSFPCNVAKSPVDTTQRVARNKIYRMVLSTPRRQSLTRERQQLQVTIQPDDTIVAKGAGGSDDATATSAWPSMVLVAPTVAALKLLCFSWIVSMTIIAWEDVIMFHPMRQANVQFPLSTRIGASTVRGLAFGAQERQALPLDLESDILHPIPSYNEVMLQHRTQRVPMWNQFVKGSSSSSSSFSTVTTSTPPKITKQDVQHAVQTIQRALILLGDCKELAKNYAWEDLAQNLRSPLLRSELDQSASLLKQATEFLSTDARNEVGFDWGSCAWRHCGALADAQEALDELDHHVGMLEPFECAFVLDIIERSLRDMLAVTQAYEDKTISIPAYELIERVGSNAIDENGEEGVDEDYMAALAELRISTFDNDD